MTVTRNASWTENDRKHIIKEALGHKCEKDDPLTQALTGLGLETVDAWLGLDFADCETLHCTTKNNSGHNVIKPILVPHIFLPQAL